MSNQESSSRSAVIKLAGGFGSPYSLKMRAVMRYRQIPFQWIPRDSRWDDLPAAKVRLMPTLGFANPDGVYDEVAVDSTPLIDRLETMYSQRSLVPADPVVAFLDYLIEDYADEWLTKAMYHYRWFYDDSISKAGKLLPFDQNVQMPVAQWRGGVDFITQRQIARMALVGSTLENREIIESSYRRFLGLLDVLILDGHFLSGDRPGRADMGIYGQLSQLALWDPSSQRVTLEIAPRVVTWTQQLDDLSWLPVVDGQGWGSRSDLGEKLHDLLCEIGSTYVPFMLANNEAVGAQSDETSCEILGSVYRQGPFSYQVKCLQWLRERYGLLTERERADVATILTGTGVDSLFL